MSLRAFSFGGGVQSMAALVLAARGEIDFPVFLFCNLGDDTEYPETVEYVRRYAIPYAEAHGIAFHELRKTVFREPVTLYARLMRDGNRSFPIPVRNAGISKPKLKGMPGKRACTQDWKVKPIARWLKQAGATRESKAVVGVGISLDEFERMKDSREKHLINEYPLVYLRLTRDNCRRIIREAGLPVPPKSSCWFCPFHSDAAWMKLYDKHPELFARAVEMERRMIASKVAAGKEPVYLTKHARPIDEVFTGQHRERVELFNDDAEEGQWSCGPFVCSGAA